MHRMLKVPDHLIFRAPGEENTSTNSSDAQAAQAVTTNQPGTSNAQNGAQPPPSGSSKNPNDHQVDTCSCTYFGQLLYQAPSECLGVCLYPCYGGVKTQKQ